MSQGSLTIYNASAGSGKTYTLTGNYLSSLFRSRYNYRKILAVTFTNKATAEMKSRILENLHKLSSGQECEYLKEMEESTGKSADWIRREAGEILNSILHDFSRFSVCTIDSFFQKIIRAFAREAGLHSGYSIELDHNIWLSAAVDEMISAATEDQKLRNWLIRYATSNIDEEKSWDLRGSILRLSEELFKEKFKLLSANQMSKLGDKEFLAKYMGEMKAISCSFEKQMKDFGAKAHEIISRADATEEMFYRKSQGVPGYVRSLVQGEIKEPNCYVREAISAQSRWSSGKVTPQLETAVSAGLDEIIKGAVTYYDRNIVSYRTSRVITRNIYALGILTDVLFNIRKLTSSENTFLLSEAGDFLRSITGGDQCPFIYEKVGNSYENFMIDEFQDTSIIQWNNLDPLLSNSLAQGFDNLVVGDIKQSIYRWRNSDWKIFLSVLEGGSSGGRIISRPLAVNWRSRSNIIRFNNSLFTILPSILDGKLENSESSTGFRALYSEAVQQDPGRKEGGFIKIEFIENEQERSSEEKVLEKLPGIIEELQDKGYEASSIGIIVRDSRQGSKVLRSLIDYSNNVPDNLKSKYNYNVVSNDSLLISGSPAVNFIVSVINLLNDPSDMIAKAAMLRFYLMATGYKNAGKVSLDIKDPVSQFPEGYENLLVSLGEKPIFEAIEEIIMFFGIGKYEWNVAYLNAFQDCVLSFTGSGNPDIGSFLEWWKSAGRKKSVVLPGNQEAMRILTIHKSKGLEFRAVILPFISWELDHPPFKQPLLWVEPSVEPFNKLGVIPVKCSKELEGTIFSGYMADEKYSVYLDNLNLLYVAMTRAKDVLYGFSVNNPRNGSIAGVLKEAFTNGNNDSQTDLRNYFDPGKNIFEMGEIPERKNRENRAEGLISSVYPVNRAMGSLRLKLHGENYFSAGSEEIRKRINYGKLMHEIFEGINVAADVTAAVRKLVIEGKLPEDEAPEIESKVLSIINSPEAAPWFSPGNLVLKEAGILLTSGNIRRPDRVIIRNGKATVIDFKFGEENPGYIEQVELYRGLLAEMGFDKTDAYIWYVDRNKIVAV